MESDLPTLPKVCKVKKNPTPIKISVHRLSIVRRNAKRHYIPIQCSVQLAIFEYQMGNVFLKHFIRLTVDAFLNPLLRSCLMICVPIENQPAGY